MDVSLHKFVLWCISNWAWLGPAAGGAVGFYIGVVKEDRKLLNEDVTDLCKDINNLKERAHHFWSMGAKEYEDVEDQKNITRVLVMKLNSIIIDIAALSERSIFFDAKMNNLANKHKKLRQLITGQDFYSKTRVADDQKALTIASDCDTLRHSCKTSVMMMPYKKVCHKIFSKLCWHPFTIYKT